MLQQAEAWLRRVDVRWWLAAFWLFWLACTVVMVLPASELPAIDMWDKAEHAVVFFVLTLLVWLAYPQRALALLSVWLFAYGVGIECVQYFIPSRSFSLLDVLADTVGILPAWWVLRQVRTA